MLAIGAALAVGLQRTVGLSATQTSGARPTGTSWSSDNDFLASPDMMLEPGGRVRVVALRERMDEVTALFGDSYRQLSEIEPCACSWACSRACRPTRRS